MIDAIRITASKLVEFVAGEFFRQLVQGISPGRIEKKPFRYRANSFLAVLASADWIIMAPVPSP